MDFKQADEQFKKLKARFTAGELTETQFKAQLQDLMVQDTQGTWWMIGYETERWYRHDGTNWVQADPPEGLAPAVPAASALRPEPAIPPEGGDQRGGYARRARAAAANGCCPWASWRACASVWLLHPYT